MFRYTSFLFYSILFVDSGRSLCSV